MCQSPCIEIYSTTFGPCPGLGIETAVYAANNLPQHHALLQIDFIKLMLSSQ